MKRKEPMQLSGFFNIQGGELCRKLYKEQDYKRSLSTEGSSCFLHSPTACWRATPSACLCTGLRKVVSNSQAWNYHQVLLWYSLALLLLFIHCLRPLCISSASHLLQITDTESQSLITEPRLLDKRAGHNARWVTQLSVFMVSCKQ